MTKGPCLEKQIAVLEEKLDGAKTALELQAREYERRLEILNNSRQLEFEQLKDIQIKFLSRETYELNHQLLEQKIETVQRLVYIGIGGVLMLELVLKYLIK